MKKDTNKITEKAFELLHEARAEIVGGIVVTALIATIGIIFSFVKNNIIGAISILLAILWLICSYIMYKRDPPRILETGKPFIFLTKGAWTYPRLRRWATIGFFTLPILLALGLLYLNYTEIHAITKTRILVANFGDPTSEERYHVTDTIFNRLRSVLTPYEDIEVLPLGRRITELEGHQAAIQAAIERNATLIIWGWYGVTDEKVQTSINFEFIGSGDIPGMCPAGKGNIRITKKSDIETLKIQADLSSEINYVTLFSAGMIRYMQNDWEEAVKFFNRADAQDIVWVPSLEQSGLYFYRGLAHSQLGDKDKALFDFNKAIEFEPDFSLAYHNRGVIFREQGNLDEALSDFTKVIEMGKGKPCDYVVRGLTYNDQGFLEFAINDYNEAIKLDPAFHTPYNNRGTVYLAKGLNAKALDDFNKAILLEPADPLPYYNRARVYEALGNIQMAISDYKTVLELTSDMVLKHTAEKKISELTSSS